MSEHTGLTCAACASPIGRGQVAIFRDGQAFHLPCHHAARVVTLVARRGHRGGERSRRGHGDLPRPRPSRERPGPSSGSARPERPLAGIRILVVEDNREHLGLVEWFLRYSGAVVRTATSAKDALAEFEASPPDLVVTDLAMPGEDGFALIRRIRERPAERGGQVPVLALTAHAHDEDQHRTAAAGFAAHLPMPLDWDRLLEAIHRSLGRTAP